MATPTRQPKRRSDHLAVATAAIARWARHWWSGSDDPRVDRDSRMSSSRPQELYGHPVDGRSLWHDAVLLVGGLALGMLLIGGGIWGLLHYVNQKQHTGPAKTKAVAKSTAHPASDRGLQLSALAVPANPQVGHAIVIPVRALDTSGVQQTLLYDGSEVVSRQPGMATSVRWTPTTAGTHQLKVAVLLDNDEQAVSAPLPINVSAGSSPRPVSPLAKVTPTAQTLVDAINTKNWDAFRQIDPSKSGWSNQKLKSDYSTLVKDTLVPVSTKAGPNGVVRLYAGLVANEQSRTELFCVTWDVDTSAHTVVQVDGRGLANALPAGAAADQARQQLLGTCASG